MKVFTCLLLSVFLVFASSDSTQDQQLERPSIHSLPNQYSTYIGIAGGYTSGYGLSIRKWVKNDWGLQFTLFPMYTHKKVGPVDDGTASDSGFRNEGQLSFGILYLKKLAEFRFGRISYYGGGNVLMFYDNHDYYSIESHYKYDELLGHGDYTETIRYNTGYSFSKELTLGTGAGAEFYIWRFALHVLLGLRASYKFSKGQFTVMPSVEGGAQFRLF